MFNFFDLIPTEKCDVILTPKLCYLKWDLYPTVPADCDCNTGKIVGTCGPDYFKIKIIADALCKFICDKYCKEMLSA